MAKTYTNEEMREILQDFTVRKIQAFEQEIIKLRKREELRSDLKKAEVAKAVIPPHRHNSGLSVGSGVEDIPAAAINQNDNVHPAKKAEGHEETAGEISPDDLCKMCGKSHELGKACMGKSALSDKVQEGADEQIKEKEIKTSAKEVKAPGSGGQIKRGPKAMKKSAELKNDLKKSTAEMIEASKGSDLKKFQDGIKKVALLRLEVEELEKNAIMGYGGTMGAPDPGTMGMPGAMKAELDKGGGHGRESKDRPVQVNEKKRTNFDREPRNGSRPQRNLDPDEKYENSWAHSVMPGYPAEKAEPPMAKPPSGKNMNTHVPTSKPMTPPKMAGAPAMKDELEKGVMADIARRNSPPGPQTQAPMHAPATKMPTPDQQAGRAASHQAALQGAFQPKAPVVSGLELQPKKPGIFGRIGNK